MTGPIRRDGRLEFRALCEADLPMLAEWLRRRHVVEWWAPDAPRPTVEELRSDYLLGPAKDPSAALSYICCEDGAPIGFIQSYVAMGSGGGWWKDETDPGVRGIDQFLADANRLGQGLGTRMVRAFVERLLADPGVTKVQTDPDPANTRAIRCYEKAGFRALREIVTPDGRAMYMVRDRGPSP